MALVAGVVTVTIEFAQGLKDCDFFGRQDPYCIVRCGGQQFRTKTHKDGGKNPVWNETFSFNIINENTIELQVMDEDVGPDDLIGTVTFSMAKAREHGQDHLQAPVVSKRSKKQHGFVSIGLKFTTNDSIKPAAAHQQQAVQPQQQPVAYYAAQPMPMPMPYYPAAPMMYGAPVPAPYGAAMPGFAPAAPMAYAAYPQAAARQ